MKRSGVIRPPGASGRSWRTQMSKRQLAVVEAVAGGQLAAFGYEVATTPSIRAKTTATTVKAWRRTGGKVAGSVRNRVRRGSPPQTGTV
jgi:hypothetical protein